MNWYIFSLLAVVSYSIGNIITKYVSSRLSSFAGALGQAVGAIIIAIITFFVFQTFTSRSGSLDRGNFIAAAISGGLWIIGQMFLFIALSKNAPISIVIPFVMGGLGVGGVIGGVLFFKESLTMIQTLGIITILVGSVMLAK